MGELATLVAEAKRVSGMSYKQLERAAYKANLPISGTSIANVATGKTLLPAPEVLAALARVLPTVNETQLKEAAARQAEVHVEHNVDFNMGRLIGRVNDLPEESRLLFYRLAEAIADELAGKRTRPTYPVRDEEGHTGRVIDRRTAAMQSRQMPAQDRPSD